MPRQPRAGLDPGAVIEAACSGDVSLLGGLLAEDRAGVLAARSESGSTALHVAAASGHMEAVVLLLGAKADPQAEALAAAAFGAGSETMKLLLDAKADPLAEDKNGYVPLHAAAAGGQIEAVALLLEVKADLQAEDKHGSTALHHAVCNGQTEAAKLLLEAKADPQAAEDEHGITALHQAVCNGQTEAAKLLLEAKADLQAEDKEGATALHATAEMGQTEALKLLLAAKANPQAKDKSGATALQAAELAGHHETAAVLRTHIAELDDQRRALGEELIREEELQQQQKPEGKQKKSKKQKKGANASRIDPIAVLKAADSGDVAALGRMLAEDPAAVLGGKGAHEATALHHAAYHGRTEAMKLLLEAKTDPQAKGAHEATALHHAACHGNTESLKLLLEAKADPQAKNKYGGTALHWAAGTGHTESLKLLLEAKADPQARSKYGGTALHSAAGSGQTEALKLLLEAKADTQAKDEYGRTPLQLAEERGQHETAAPLRTHIAAELDDQRRALAEELIREEEQQQKPEGKQKKSKKKKMPTEQAKHGSMAEPAGQQKLDQEAQANKAEQDRLAAREAARKQEEEYNRQLQEEQRRRQNQSEAQPQPANRAASVAEPPWQQTQSKSKSKSQPAQQPKPVLQPQPTNLPKPPEQAKQAASSKLAALQAELEELKRGWADEKRQLRSHLEQERAAWQQEKAAWQQETSTWREKEATWQQEKAELQRQLAELAPAPAEADASGPALVSFEQLRAATNGFSQVNLLSSGGQCTGVFRGSWRGQNVAVKRIERHGEGFRRELTALSAVRHENVLRVIAYNEEGDPAGAQYLVMPLMIGGDLATSLSRLKAAGRVRVLLDGLRGLQALHEAGILHFDIKPENLLIDGQGRCRLGDCGLSRPMKMGMNETMAQTTMVAAGQVGTPGYMDPEWTRTGQFHRHSDIYAMGLTMLQVVTGRPSVLWEEGDQHVTLTDFCEDVDGDAATIMDPAAEWPEEVACKLVELGLRCTVIGGRRVVAKRPSVDICIDEVKALMQLPPAQPPPDAQKECIICLEAPRGRHRFMPCKHSVCCGECAEMLKQRGPCPVCSTPIEQVQEGLFFQTYSG